MRVPERLRDIQKMIYFPRTHLPEICHAVEAVSKSPFNNQDLGGPFESDHRVLTTVDCQKLKKKCLKNDSKNYPRRIEKKTFEFDRRLPKIEKKKQGCIPV